MPGEANVLPVPEMRETEILDDIMPEVVGHPQSADLPPSASPPATVSPEDVALETGTEAEASQAPESRAPDSQALSAAPGTQRSESLSRASVDEDVVPVTDIYFVSPAL